jgi:hypothetical protein
LHLQLNLVNAQLMNQLPHRLGRCWFIGVQSIDGFALERDFTPLAQR